MEDGNVNEFLQKIQYQEEAVLFHGKKYFFNPGYEPEKKEYNLLVEKWELNDDYIETIFQSTGNSQDAIQEIFLKSPIWDGMTFWEAEKEMTWVDW